MAVVWYKRVLGGRVLHYVYAGACDGGNSLLSSLLLVFPSPFFTQPKTPLRFLGSYRQHGSKFPRATLPEQSERKGVLFFLTLGGKTRGEEGEGGENNKQYVH